MSQESVFDVDAEQQEIIKYLESITGCRVEVDGERYVLHPKTDITFVRTTTTIKGEL